MLFISTCDKEKFINESVIPIVHSAYIHIPFCEHICHYCDFNKVFIQKQPVEEYLSALDREIEETLKNVTTKQLKTIFVGGGTPTSLSMKQLEQLLMSIHERLLPFAEPSLEYTFEANPGEVSKEKLDLLHSFGVNRLSFGVQAFQDSLLERLGRSHRVKDVFKTIEKAKGSGFKNINVDLMYSLPDQTLNDFRETLKIAFSLGVQHFSGYSLQVEPKTVFYNLMKKGKLPLPTQEEEALMYDELINQMANHKFEQYEISNFALSGYESKHNLTYWNNEEYYGLGAGAHGYVNGSRYANAGPVPKYISLVKEKGIPRIESNLVTKQERMEEELFLGLRKLSGVSKQTFYDRFGVNLYDVFGTQINEQKIKGLLMETNAAIMLSRKGLFLGNEVFQEFIAV